MGNGTLFSKVKKSGDTMTGTLTIKDADINLKSNNIDITNTNITDNYNYGIKIYDKNNQYIGGLNTGINNSNNFRTVINATRIVNNTIKENNLILNVDVNGNNTIQVTDPTAWRTALHAINNTGARVTGNYYINNLNMDVTSTSLAHDQVSFIDFQDVNNKDVGWIGVYQRTDGRTQTILDVHRNTVDHRITLEITNTGTRKVFVTEAAPWREAFETINKSGDEMTGNLGLTRQGTENLLYIKRPDRDWQTAPSSDTWIGGMCFYDKNMVSAGYVEMKNFTDKDNHLFMVSRTFNSGNITEARIELIAKNQKIYTNCGINFETGVDNPILYATKAMVSFKTGDSSGHGIYIGGGGNTTIGGGESAQYVYTDTNISALEEKLYLTSDSDINIWTNCQGGLATATKNTINTNGVYSGAAMKLRDPGNAGYYLGLKWSGNVNSETADYLAAWSSTVPDGYTKVIQAMSWTEAHKKLTTARPMFKYKTKTYTEVTLNKGGGGYAATADYGGVPTTPDGYSLFNVHINNWGTISSKEAVNVTENGLYIMGSNGATISNITLKFVYILSDNYVAG